MIITKSTLVKKERTSYNDMCKSIRKEEPIMKKIIAGLLAIALTAAVSIGATLAYLTDTDEDVNVMTLGQVKIDQLEYERVDVESTDKDATVQEFHDNKPLLPAVTEKNFDYKPGTSYVDWEQIGKDGYTSTIWDPTKINNEVDKMVFVKNKGDYDAYVRSIFAFEAGKYTTLDEFQKMVHLNLNTTDYTWEWVETPVAIPNEDGSATTNYFVATATYNKVLAPSALTEISLSQIALDSTATNADVEAFGDTYQVLVKSQGIQADGFDDPFVALTDGFGAIAADNIPWENDSAIAGLDLKTALHYYEGNKSNQITTKVTNVIFGKNAAYTNITDQYTGTLVDVEQDVPVYAYYVPNDSNYDIYFLANDDIYLPENSNSLFREMTALKTVDTGNLNVSRAKDMGIAFYRCINLEELDVSHWDTSNVTSLRNTFRECSKLKELDVSKWDTGNVTSMTSTFELCTSLEKLELGGWDTSKVTEFGRMFKTKGNTGNMKFKELDVANWDVSSAIDLNCMFYGCGQLTSLDLSSWDVSNAQTISHMFADCYKLESVNLTGWNTPNLKTIDALFNNCNVMVSVDVSDLDTANVVEFSQVFEYCGSLETIIGLDKWDTTSGQDFGEMFTNCGKLKSLDLSTFDTTHSKDSYVNASNGDGNDRFHYFLTGCNSLESITLGANFSFDGDGSYTKWTFEMPSATNVTGWDGNWYDADGNAYAPSAVPEQTARTYYAVNPVANP